jgi:hypothetical protein
MSRTAAEPDLADPVTRDDLEAKLRELKGEVDDTAQAATGVAVAVAAAAVVGVVAIAFLIGKRRGRKKTTVVEIRRV